MFRKTCAFYCGVALVLLSRMCVADAPITQELRQEWQQVLPAHPVGSSGVMETVYEHVVGGDRVALHLYARLHTESDAKSGAQDMRALLYLPGTNMNGAPALEDENHNLWLYLAARGVTVVALDYRSHFVAEDAQDFRAMSNWTTDVYVDDAHLALAWLHGQLPKAKLYVAGFSRGVTLAYGLTCRAADVTLAGLIALDGGFKREPSAGSMAAGVATAPPSYAAAREIFMAKGAFADDVSGQMGWPNRQALMQGALGTDQFAQQKLVKVLFNAWGPGRLANPGIFANPQIAGVGAASDVKVLARLLIGYDRFYPAIQNVDGKAIASVTNAAHTPVDDCWGHMTLPILFAASEKFGVAVLGKEGGGVEYSAQHSGSKDVTAITLPGYGHLDVLVAESARARVFTPLLQWMQAH